MKLSTTHFLYMAFFCFDSSTSLWKGFAKEHFFNCTSSTLSSTSKLKS